MGLHMNVKISDRKTRNAAACAEMIRDLTNLPHPLH